MVARRIIPALDVKEGRVVKCVRFLDPRDAGDPVDLARVHVVRGTWADRTGLAGPRHAAPSAIEPSGIGSQDGRFLASYITS